MNKLFWILTFITAGVMAFIIGFCLIFIRGIEAADFNVKVDRSDQRVKCQCNCFYE